MKLPTASTKPFRIILRYGLDPYNGLEESLKQLKIFAEEARLSEVMFLLIPEERSSGHPTIEQARPWMAAMRKAKAMLAEIGVEVSVNPWTTTYHTGRGRSLHKGQNFRLMVGETGADNGMTACPLCEEWQSYLVDYFVWIAEELKPVALWVEDDWRLHNHGGEMGYGGCFCEHCLSRFSHEAGVSVERDSLLRLITEESGKGSLRDKWMRFTRSSLEEPAERLASALKAARPEMRIGLMTSIPDIHSIEGRDWNSLMRLWTRGTDRYLIRPHMPPYTEEHPLVTSPGYTRQSIANLDESADIYPELENSPRCGQYSGSHAYSAWQIFNSVYFGSRGITINHFDNMGMNTLYDRGLGKHLGSLRTGLDQLMTLKLDDRDARGVKVLFSPEIAKYLRTTDGAGTSAKMYTGEDLSKFKDPDASLNALQGNSIAWSKVFYTLGISHGFTRSCGSRPGQVMAVCDQTLRCFDDASVLELLRGKLILDPSSVDILIERGFGDYIGVESSSRVALADGAYSLEEIRPDFFGELDGNVAARLCAQRCADPIWKFGYDEAVQVLSDIKSADLEPLFPASGIYRNELGGTVFTQVYPLGTGQFYMAYFSVIRQAFWRKVLFELGGDSSDQVIAHGHPLFVHALDLENGFFVAVTNVIYDKTDVITLQVSKKSFAGRDVYLLNPDGNWEKVAPKEEDLGSFVNLVFEMCLNPLESANFIIQ